ncbi:MAG: outer membrane protein assembly factor BamB [Candidatus Competibacteraceae bacterium]
MRRLGGWLLVGILWLGGTGCSWISDYLAGSDNAIPPTELQTIENPISVSKQWDAQVGSGTEGAFIRLSPMLAEGRLYAASHNGIVMALDAANGQTVWKTDTELTITAGVGVGDGLVLVGTDKGKVLALTLADGTENWRAQVSSEILAAPRVTQGIVVVRSIDGKFTGLSAAAGQRLWLYSTPAMPALTLRGAAAPLLVPGAVIAGLENGRLLILSLDKGIPISERTIAIPRGRTDLERMVDIDADPRIVGSTLYIAAYQGNITAVNLRDGGTLWSRDISNYSGLDADTSRVYITDDSDTVQALDSRTGQTLWQQTGLIGRKLSTPVVSEGYLVVGDFEGYLHWLDIDTGKIIGRVRVDSTGIRVAPVSRGGIVYVLSEGGTLAAYQVGS